MEDETTSSKPVSAACQASKNTGGWGLVHHQCSAVIPAPTKRFKSHLSRTEEKKTQLKSDSISVEMDRKAHFRNCTESCTVITGPT